MHMIHFLIKADVIHTPYMGDDKTIHDVRLVLAHDEADAERKYMRYWDLKCENYSDSYYVSNIQVLETIT
jgi:hypothetical protein